MKNRWLSTLPWFLSHSDSFSYLLGWQTVSKTPGFQQIVILIFFILLGDQLRQKAMLRDRPDVIVATPAGLLVHIRNGDVELENSVESLVVDEK